MFENLKEVNYRLKVSKLRYLDQTKTNLYNLEPPLSLQRFPRMKKRTKYLDLFFHLLKFSELHQIRKQCNK